MADYGACSWTGCTAAAVVSIKLTDWQTRGYCDPHGERLLREAFACSEVEHV